MTQTSKNRPTSPVQAAKRRGPLDGLLNPEAFKALADPTRVALLACLAKCGRTCTVGEVAACCSVDLSVVSRHLAQLAAAGVVESRKEGRAVLYRVRYGELCAWLRQLADALEACCPESDGSAPGGCCGR